ncbi:choice-of-anchor Q domain-containing protein [Spirosoma validum]|uniref:Ig-like domain-containing protein n=1 Tax=Spirosoma validum TaxID=2771355 RepID=A0A927AY15_9BACT|nr:choice-of-anchor Q domain-containing protein [Spirosoma validum]MBD2751925.1 hypothetical protein [Spirosoma validum]
MAKLYSFSRFLRLIPFWLLLGASGYLQAQTIRYVKPTATGTGAGSSWANASADLQAMIRASLSGDQVWVAAGTYTPGTDPNASFGLKDRVGIYGGFVGTETTLGQRPGFDPQGGQASILSGELGNPRNDYDNSLRVVTAQNMGNSAVLDGFVIASGYGSSGGGMYNDHASPTITNCSFQNNKALYGGGIYNTASSPRLNNCHFLSNQAFVNSGGTGGGIYNTNLSNPLLTNCSFYNNWANVGGAMCQDNRSSSTLVNCSFLGNSFVGGAIFNMANSNAILANCVLFNNGGDATFYNQSGGAVALSYCLLEPEITNFTNAGNNRTTTTSPFVSRSNPRLSATSPAIDAGNSGFNTTPTDLAGNPRLVGTSIDLGAYEYQGPLRITGQFQSVTTVCGANQPASFSVSLNQSDAFTATLYRDQTSLAQLTTSQAVIRFNQAALQSGSYQIVVITDATSVTTTLAAITVNPLPVSYTVSGGGALCPTSTGVGVTLSGSQPGVTYQLRRDGSPVASPVAGTGSGLVFANQTTTGQYTVLATSVSTGCQQLMSGSATVRAANSPLLSMTHTNVGQLGASTGTASVTVSGGTPTYTYDWTPGSPTGDGTSSISSLSAGTYSVKVTDANSCTATSIATVGTDPDLTVLLYARPGLLYGNSPMSVVVDVVENNGVSSSGLITVKVTKDAKLTLSLDKSLTSVNSRSVQNGSWSLSSDANYYILTTTQPVAAGDKLSFGLTGQLSAGSTTGMINCSATVVGGGESRANNNIDADKVEYFQQ